MEIAFINSDNAKCDKDFLKMFGVEVGVENFEPR